MGNKDHSAGYKFEENECQSFLKVDDCWFDPMAAGISVFRCAIEDGKVPHKKPFFLQLGAENYVAGYMRMEFVGYIKGQVIYEARELYPASYRSLISELPLLPV